MKRLKFGVVIYLLATCASNAQTVTDGDTLKFGKERVRLWGIDAPEIHQRYRDRWLAGIEAARKMRELVKGHQVTCENRGHDRYGRMIGLCRADGVDIQATMVRAGMAWAFVRYSSDYVREDEQAKADRLGIFAHSCAPAWKWRAKKRAKPRHCCSNCRRIRLNCRHPVARSSTQGVETRLSAVEPTGS